MLSMSYSLHVFSHPLSYTRDSFILRKIFPCFLQCDFLLQKLHWLRLKLSKKLCACSPDVMSAGVQIWRVRWPLSLQNHLQTVRVQALLSDTCCVHRAPCISLNLPLRSSRLQSSINFESIN